MQYRTSHLIYSAAFFIIISMIALNAAAQSSDDSMSRCPVKDAGSIFKKIDSTKKTESKKSFLLAIPLIGAQPATGFFFGGIAQYTFKGRYPDAKYSSLNAGITYTSKKQLLINIKNNLLLKHNKFFLSGDWRYYIFSQANYRLGSDIIPPLGNHPDFEPDSLAQPMKYNYLRLHQTISRKIKGNFYIGGGIHLDAYSDINDEKLDTANHVSTAHYNYSRQYGFNPLHYTVNGVSLNLLYDSRDNQVNANHGLFANINYRVNPALFKGQKASSSLITELRYFLPLDKKNFQHVLSIWAYAQFTTTGKLPYLNLPALGWDQRSRAGKGYVQGLFRGYNLSYTEVEYRFPITCNQLISATVFADITTASDKNRNIKLFQYLQPAAGIGLRILIEKDSRTNLVLNYGWGRKSNAFYLNAGESF